MNVKYMLLSLLAAIVIVAVASYYITGPVRGRNSELIPMSKYVVKTEHPKSAGNDYVKINGIARSANTASAIIEGEIVQEGEEVNNTRVLHIYENEIELERNGRTWRQQVNDPNKSQL
jgi:hypothetical protein